jgi:hypothetical protein
MSNKTSVRQLQKARDDFCGIGTRLAKLRLNRIGRTSILARAFRLALEIEDKSALGKKYRGEWSDRCYAEKTKLIHDLIRIFQQQGWTYGKHASGTYPRWIIYFEIPGCEQISFHTDLTIEVPDYPKEWDRKTNSTLGKLEAAIREFLKDEDQQSLF